MKTMYFQSVKSPIGSEVYKVHVESVEDGEVYKCTFSTFPTANDDYPNDSFIKWIRNREGAIELAVDYIRNHK